MLRQDNDLEADRSNLRERLARLETVMDITIKNLTTDISNLKIHYDSKITEQTTQLQRQLTDLQQQVKDLSKLISANQTPEARDHRLYWVLIAVGVFLAVIAIGVVGVWIQVGKLPIDAREVMRGLNG